MRMFPCLPRLSLPPATASLASSAASASARPPALRPVGRVARFNTSQPSRSIDPHLPLFIFITDLLTATRRHSVLASWTDCRRCRRRSRYHACLLNHHHQQPHRLSSTASRFVSPPLDKTGSTTDARQRGAAAAAARKEYDCLQLRHRTPSPSFPFSSTISSLGAPSARTASPTCRWILD